LSLSDAELREIVANLATRPGHEPVRRDVQTILIGHLGASRSDVKLEQPLPEVHGRLDALLCHTVFEFKKDLRREKPEAERQLGDYLRELERRTGHHYVGVATDGAEFIPYELQRDKLVARTPYKVSRTDVRGLALWLSPFVATRPSERPDPEGVRKELGKESLVFEVAEARLRELWNSVREHPEVALKRKLWADRLQLVYGTLIDDDTLFFQHTYLTIVAKTMATLVLGVEIPEPADLLVGKPFQDAGIDGVVESDSFDWVLATPDSDDLIRRIAAQVARFRLGDIEHDVLKGLYESLIDPQQRHDLGDIIHPIGSRIASAHALSKIRSLSVFLIRLAAREPFYFMRFAGCWLLQTPQVSAIEMRFNDAPDRSWVSMFIRLQSSMHASRIYWPSAKIGCETGQESASRSISAIRCNGTRVRS